jgi:hypothetical protein
LLRAQYLACGRQSGVDQRRCHPDQFDLSIAQKERSYRARMVWRGANEASVAFLSEYTQDMPVPLEWVKRLRDSETEKAVLRQRIAQLTERGAV